VPKISKESPESGRNRAQGWTHAKRSGHRHESDVAARLQSDLAFANGLPIRCFNEKYRRPLKVNGAAHRRNMLMLSSDPEPTVSPISISSSLRTAQAGSLSKIDWRTGVTHFCGAFFRRLREAIRSQSSRKVRTGIDSFIGGTSRNCGR